MSSRLDKIRAHMAMAAFGVRSRIDKMRAHSKPVSPKPKPPPLPPRPPRPPHDAEHAEHVDPAQLAPSWHALLESHVLETGTRVFYSERRGVRFYGDLLPDGRIRFSDGQVPDFAGRHFTSPTAFNNFCGRLADPAYRGNGFVYTYYKRSEDEWVPLAALRRVCSHI